jgi:glycosyltransferase involved in cell wall biosynthesis
MVHLMGKHVAVIPCLDEAQAITTLVRSVGRYIPQVMVVDDGSRDHTAKLAAAAGAIVVSHGRNLGKGAAVKSGLTRALEQGFSWALLLDGDGQHQPGDIPAFIQKAESTRADLVVGNRMSDAGSMPWLRRQVNRWMSRQLSRRAGISLPDSQCGFRLVNLHAWAALRVQTEHFEIESETLLAFIRAGHRIEFVPVQVVARGRRSHIRPVRDTVRWLRWYLMDR